jgi:proteasome accessory factor A
MLADGGSATALELSWQYLEWLTKYAEQVEPDPIYERVLSLWEGILTDLETDPSRLADRLDWAAKLRILEGFRERDGLTWDDPKLRALDLQYHDVDPERGLYYRLAERGSMQRLFTDEEIETAVTEPPQRTRAYFRGRCVSRFSQSLVAANWDSLVFEVGEDTLKRVPMMEPLRGTKERVDTVLDQAADAAALVRALGGSYGRTGTEDGPAEGN